MIEWTNAMKVTRAGWRPPQGQEFRDELMKRISHLVGCIAICALAGCAALLPKGKADTRSPFDSFEAAERALSQVTAYKTTIADLRALGFDLVASDNVTLISYPTVVARLIPSSSVALDAVDPGIRDCVLAQKACQAFEFQIAQQRRQREGNFLMDWLNFRRTTEITGWSFSALIALRYDVVVFTSYGGERSTHRLDQQTNPLGPLQGVGEATAAALVKN
jgi:hypothetical protein